MIEDALKSTRTVHRLIMTVSLVTLVFAFSLHLPSEKVAQREAIDALLNADFLAYDRFVEGQVEAFKSKELIPIGTKLNEKLEGGGHLILSLHHLGEAFFEPLHVGRILTDEVALSQLGNATLVTLDALNGLNLASDVQVVVPRIDELIPEIETFLVDNPEAGKRVDTIRTGIDEMSFVAESFLPGSKTMVGLYFELVGPVRLGGAPVFNASFPADVIFLPGTSFLEWLNNNKDMEEVASIESGRVVFAPELGSVPNGFREEKLGLLYQRLVDDIASSGPEKQSATILGTKVPGLLIAIASPLTLIVLSYYFANHTGHLRRIIGKDKHAFDDFAWMPLAIQTEIPPLPFQKLINAYRIPGWILETLTSAVLLPVASIVVLYRQLGQFGDVAVWTMLIIAIAGVGVILLGIRSVQNIRAAP